jgi:cytochrome P450
MLGTISFTILLVTIITAAWVLLGKKKKIPFAKEQNANTRQDIITQGLNAFLEGAHKSKGPVIQFSIGDHFYVSVNDAEGIDQLRKAKTSIASKKPIVRIHWKAFESQATRDQFAEALSAATFETKMAELLPTSQALIKKWIQQGKEVKIQKDLLDWAFKATILVLCGKNVPMEDLQEQIDAYLAEVGANGGLRADNQKVLGEETTGILALDKVLFSGRKEIAKNPAGKGKYVLDILVGDTDANTGELFTARTARSILTTLILAIYPAVATTLVWNIFELTQNQEAHLRVQQEADRLYHGKIPQTMQDLDKLEYIVQELKETMRMFPPTLYEAHRLEENTTIMGFDVEKNTTILVPVWCLHNNTKYYDYPLIFNPQRFDNPNLEHPALIPFGFAKGRYPAEEMVWCLLKFQTALFSQNCTFELGQKAEDVIPEERLVLMAKNDVLVNVYARE